LLIIPSALYERAGAVSVPFLYEIYTSLPAETQYRQGFNRNQAVLFPVTIDQAIDQDNEVRIINLFVASLEIGNMGFKTEFVENGRPGALAPSSLVTSIKCFLLICLLVFLQIARRL